MDFCDFSFYEFDFESENKIFGKLFAHSLLFETRKDLKNDVCLLLGFLNKNGI